MKNKATLILVSVLLVVGLLLSLVACGQPAPAIPTTPTTPTTPAQPGKITIATNWSYGWPLGIDAKKMVEIDVKKINDSGGLDIGGQKYLVNIIYDDNKFDFALAKTLAQKHISQDKANFCLGDPYTTAAFDTYEEAKMPFVTSVYDLIVFDPAAQWRWNAGCALTTYPATVPYAASKFPNLKTYVGTFPDRHDGRVSGEQFESFAKNAGLTVIESLYYPPDQTDLSALGTKIKQLNPDFLCAYGGGPPLDAGMMKAAYSAGWRGQIIGSATMPGSTIVGIAGEGAEGAICLAWPAEFDSEPATTPLAQEFKKDWIAAYGEWTDPEVVITTVYWRLKDGLVKAGSIDKEKVKAALDAPTTYESPLGTHATFQRPQQGNNRYVDHVIGNLPTKIIKNGQSVFYDTIPLENMMEYVQKNYGM